MIKTDSEMESLIIKRLVKQGFSNKWRRMRSGVSFGLSRYTPDVELSVLHDSETVRALVEFKAFSVAEFTSKDRRRMLASAHFYRNSISLLYIEKTKNWYLIGGDGSLTLATQPIPGRVMIDELPRPRIIIPIFNRYGRSYYATPGIFISKKIADALDFGVTALLRPAKKRRRRRS
jgi:hypothetical protein